MHRFKVYPAISTWYIIHYMLHIFTYLYPKISHVITCKTLVNIDHNYSKLVIIKYINIAYYNYDAGLS